MKTTAELKAEAKDALRGKWGQAVILKSDSDIINCSCDVLCGIIGINLVFHSWIK